jgi:2-C-methyl-D-erythritol 2,4-cyclodiphosphate synthase/2-C-methyl-D-erythritol 4-phosphate cytidylyltransferase
MVASAGSIKSRFAFGKQQVKGNEMKHVAILLAGGSGSRMGSSVEDKILAEVAGKPVFAHVLDTFHASATQDAYVIVARDNQQLKELARIVKKSPVDAPAYFTLGGDERQDSVRAGLDMVPTSTEWITVHDCARPAVSTNALKAIRKTLLSMKCAVSLAHRVVDTIRSFEEPPVDTPSKGKLLQRDKLWAMETPQAFPRALIEQAHEALSQPVTDDIAAIEAMGEPVILVESKEPNPKLTRPADFALLENLLRTSAMTDQPCLQTRVGLGYDIHRLKEGLPLVLGGVEIDSPVGLEGHSDADVLCHAIADAILGGCGLPDIGHYFPNTDPSIAGISSLEIVKAARKEAKKAGMKVVHVDATLIAEQPKVAPYIARMKTILAKVLKLQPIDIGIKATTQEKIGALGQSAGIAAHAVATLRGNRRGSTQA